MATKATRSSRRRRRPGAAELSPEVLWYLESREYTLDLDRGPLIRTAEPRDVKGAQFDPARVDKVIRALRSLRHTKGKWAGKPLEPSAWQVAYILAPVFGWVAPDDDGNLQRIIREVYIEVPRKNGKTTLVAGLAMYLAFADGEPGAEVIMAAASRGQALAGFKPIAAVASKSRLLRRAGVRALAHVIEQAKTSSTVRTASSRGDLEHGGNVHGGLVDELHVHKKPDVLEAIESGTGSRDQPLVITITTADDGQQVTVYAERRLLIERVARGVIKDPTRYGVIFAMAESDDPFDEANVARANPSYPTTPTRAYIRSQQSKAKTSAVQMASYERLNCGKRVKRDKRFIAIERWNRNRGTVIRPAELVGRRAFGGIDLGSTSDLTAWVMMFPTDAGGYDLLCHFWLPEAALEDLDKRTQRNASGWVRDGWLTLTPGDVTDYDFIREQVGEDLETFDVVGIGYDRWNSTQIITDLNNDGAPLVEVGQGYASMNSPMLEIERLVLKGTTRVPLLHHGGNPVLTWMVDNLRTETNAAGNVKPSKRTSMDKIDGFSAMCDALAVALAAEPETTSAYAGGGNLIIA